MTKAEVPKPSLKPILTWDVVQKRFPWSVVLLIGAGFAISESVTRSGLSTVVSCFINNRFEGSSPIAIQAAITVLVTFMTEFASNAATASIFVPIVFVIGQSLKLHPLYLSLPSAIAPSFSFMLPMSTPPNAIVYDTGVISMLEMAAVGLVMNFLCIGITLINMNTWTYWLFDLGTFPEYAAHKALQLNLTCPM